MKRWLIPFCCMLLSFQVEAAAKPVEALKAAYVFYFSKFITWPPEDAQSVLVLCSDYSDERVSSQLATLAGNSVAGRLLEIRQIGAETGWQQCDLAYSADPHVTLPQGVFLVGEAEQGQALIRFVLEHGRLTFDIDLERAEAAGFQISSRLLRLAREVHH